MSTRIHSSPRVSRLSAVCILLFLVILAGCGGSGSTNTGTPTVVATSTSSSQAQFSPVDLGIPSAALNSPVVGPLPGDTPMHVRLTFKIKNQQPQGSQPQSGTVGQSQDLQKLANQIGITDAQYQKIQQALGIQGVTLTLSSLHTELKIDAVARTIGVLFQTQFVNHNYNGRVFYAPATTPLLPTFIENEVIAVTGLDNYSVAPKTAFSSLSALSMLPAFRTNAARQQADCNAPQGTLFPNQVGHAYGYDQFASHGYRGQNMTINLVEIDGVAMSDVQNYAQCVQYQGHIRFVNIDGAPPQPQGETALDMDMIMGLAPNVNMVDYQASSPTGTDLEDALQRIIDDNARGAPPGSVVSISIEAAENFTTLSYLKAMDQRLYLLTQKEQMTVFVASGDCAAFMDGTFGSDSVSFPASDPYAVAVGGTVLQVNQNNTRASETVWSDGSNQQQCNNAWGSGGGSSNFFQQPAYQAGAGVSNANSRGFRQLPDISAVAFNLPVYFGGSWVIFSGTSAATPIWATGMTLLNQALIQRYHKFFYGTGLFYAVENNRGRSFPFYDVTQGNNLAFQATTGWDFASGLGTPNLVDIYGILSRYA
jgi:kumamolisin